MATRLPHCRHRARRPSHHGATPRSNPCRWRQAGAVRFPPPHLARIGKIDTSEDGFFWLMICFQAAFGVDIKGSLKTMLQLQINKIH
jgi:hypothetical protein